MQKKEQTREKSPWPIDTTNELIDIICSDNYFSKRLIFTNNKTSKNSEVYEKVIEELKKRTKKVAQILHLMWLRSETNLKNALVNAKGQH